MILVDTGVLSLAFRRKRRELNTGEVGQVYALEELFKRGQAALIGPIRQEILSGIASREQFEVMKVRLGALEDLALDREAYELAAEFYNRCRGAGVAAGDIDMMICAAGRVHGCEIFTNDGDFARYARVLPIRLYEG